MVYSVSFNQPAYDEIKNCVSAQGKEGVQQILEKYRLSDNTEQKSAFFYNAVGEGLDSLVKAFIELGFPEYEPQDNQLHPIHLAIQNSHFKVASLLAKTYPEMLTWVDANRDTALHVAARAGNKALINSLVKRGANLEARNLRDNLPYQEAKLAGYTKLAKSMKKWQKQLEKEQELTVLKLKLRQLTTTNRELEESLAQLQAQWRGAQPAEDNLREKFNKVQQASITTQSLVERAQHKIQSQFELYAKLGDVIEQTNDLKEKFTAENRKFKDELEVRLGLTDAAIQEFIQQANNEKEANKGLEKQFEAVIEQKTQATTHFQQGAQTIYGLFRNAATKGWNLNDFTNHSKFPEVKNIIKIIPMTDNSIILVWKQNETSISLERYNLKNFPHNKLPWKQTLTLPFDNNKHFVLFLSPTEEKLYFLSTEKMPASFSPPRRDNSSFIINATTGMLEYKLPEIKHFQYVSENNICITTYTDILIIDLNSGRINSQLSENYYVTSSIYNVDCISSEEIIFGNYEAMVLSKHNNAPLALPAQFPGGIMVYPLYKWNLRSKQCAALPIALPLAEGEAIQTNCRILGKNLWEISSTNGRKIMVDISQAKVITPKTLSLSKPYQHVITYYQSLGDYTVRQDIKINTSYEFYSYKDHKNVLAESLDYTCIIYHSESREILMSIKEPIDIDSNPLVLLSTSLIAGVCLADSTIKIWDLNTRSPVPVSTFPSQGVDYLGASAPGELLGFPKDGPIHKWTNLELACQAVEEKYPECKVM